LAGPERADLEHFTAGDPQTGRDHHLTDVQHEQTPSVPRSARQRCRVRWTVPGRPGICDGHGRCCFFQSCSHFSGSQ
jgi:hypothetical protein